VVAVGRLRAPLEAPGREYEKRIGDLVGFRADEVAQEPDAGSGVRRAMAVEADRIRAKLVDGAWRVALDPGGRPPASSDALAAWLAERLEAARPVAFLIGGPHGLDPGLAGECEERMSLGPLIFPHQLARVVLAEQLYRALCVRTGHPYPR
jgi:23S rRNA (pseudouridine1915-N3)-methyltransferase